MIAAVDKKRRNRLEQLLRYLKTGRAKPGASTDNKEVKTLNPNLKAEDFDHFKLTSNCELKLAVYARRLQKEPVNSEIASRLDSDTCDSTGPDGYLSLFLIEFRDWRTYAPHADAHKGTPAVVHSSPRYLDAYILGDFVVIQSSSGKLYDGTAFEVTVDIINWRTGVRLLSTTEQAACHTFTILSEERYVTLHIHSSEENPKRQILRFHVRKFHNNTTVAIYELPELEDNIELLTCYSPENAHSLKKEILISNVSVTPSRSTLPLCLFDFSFRATSFTLAIDTKVFFPDIEPLSPPFPSDRKPDDVIPWSDWGETYTRCFSGIFYSSSWVQGYTVITDYLTPLDFDPNMLTRDDCEGEIGVKFIKGELAFKSPSVFKQPIETRLAYRQMVMYVSNLGKSKER